MKKSRRPRKTKEIGDVKGSPLIVITGSADNLNDAQLHQQIMTLADHIAAGKQWHQGPK